MAKMRSARRRATRGTLALGLSLLLAALAIPAAADPTDQLERNRTRQAEIAAQRERKEAQAADVSVEVRALDEKRRKKEARVAALEADLAQLDAEISRVENRLTVAQQGLALLEAELASIQARLDERTELFTGRAVAAYKAGPGAYLDSLLSSTTFTDLIDRFAYHQSALAADSELVDEIQLLRDATESRQELAEQKKLEIAKAKLALEEDRAVLDAKRDERAQILAELEGVLRQKESVLNDLRGDAAHLAEIEAQLQQEESQILAALQGSSTGGPLPTGGGQLLMPAAGPITSGFGYRTHPIFGDRRLHTGIDISAGYGAPVVAADAGRVAYVGVMSGYGNVVVIDHGGGLGTTYNHLSAFYVGTGQQVGRGVQIGAVGCTGYCTGPHLHFEVRVNGSPVDPMPYLQ